MELIQLTERVGGDKQRRIFSSMSIGDAARKEWRGLLNLLRYAIATGNGGIAAGALIAYWLIQKLPASDVKEVLMEIVRAPWFAILGWMLFIASVAISSWIVRWKENMHAGEIERMAQVKKEAQQIHFKSDLFSSKG